MDLIAARRLARTLMTQHGVGHVEFAFDRSVRRFGQCVYRNGVPVKITLSSNLVTLNPEAEVRNTILHEIAHALAGKSAGHGPAWRRVARSIGCSGERLHNAATPERRYVGKCPKCPAEFPRHRRIANAFHPACVKRAGIGNKPVPNDFLIVWVDTARVAV